MSLSKLSKKTTICNKEFVIHVNENADLCAKEINCSNKKSNNFYKKGNYFFQHQLFKKYIVNHFNKNTITYH